MVEFSNQVDCALSSIPKRQFATECQPINAHFFPVYQGRVVSCFTPLHVGYSEKYTYNLEKNDGDHLKVLCWGSSAYHCLRPHLRRHQYINSHVFDCKHCTFCLEQAEAYRLYIHVAYKRKALSWEEVKQEPICKTVKAMVDAVSPIFNAPIEQINVQIDFGTLQSKTVKYNAKEGILYE